MITALCNIYIGTEQKFMLFKDSFSEVFDISDNWLIYIRGQYKFKVIDFIKNLCSEKIKNITFFDSLYEENWVKSSLEMLKNSKYNYVYLYWEDHLLINNLSYFKEIVWDMINNNVDYLQYSMHDVGLSPNTIDILYPDENNNIKTIELNKENYNYIKKEFTTKFYPFALISILKKTYFLSLLNDENIRSIDMNKMVEKIVCGILLRYPLNRIFLNLINKITLKFGFKFNIFPKNTPFNLEKSIYDFDKKYLPIKIGVSKNEIFGNWDDDNGYSGSSLIKRGLYPRTLIAKNSYKNIDLSSAKQYSLKKGVIEEKLYYSYLMRTPVPKKIIKVLKGKILITGLDEKYILSEHESIIINSNISHSLEGIEDSIYVYYISNYIENVSYYDMK